MENDTALPYACVKTIDMKLAAIASSSVLATLWKTIMVVLLAG